MFRFALPVAAVLAVAAAGPALAESSTIRIEPRPYYGAIVTIEQGVRVWRPLPVTKYVVINPENKTPLNLSLSDVRETKTSNNFFYGSEAGTPQAAGGGNTYSVPLWAPRGVGPRHHGGRGGKGGHHRGGGIGPSAK
ncbi:MAG: hypothetical protein AB7O43_22795 [Hyphomicrobiaceae bacterium]